MKTKTLLIIALLISFGCSKKSDPAPIHTIEDYIGNYSFYTHYHKIQFIVTTGGTMYNGLVDGGAGTQWKIAPASDHIDRIEIIDVTGTTDVIINNIHFSGNKVIAETVLAIEDGTTDTQKDLDLNHTK